MSLLDVQTVPRMFKVRQEFPRSEPLDISATVAAQIASVQDLLKPNARVAVTVGSRGIANLREIVLTVLDALKAAGVQPSDLTGHGQPRRRHAQKEGQKRILADYGITEETMKVPIEAAMTTREVGRTVDGVPAFTSMTALAADGIVVLNRVKPHTDYFSRTVGERLDQDDGGGYGQTRWCSQFSSHGCASRL